MNDTDQPDFPQPGDEPTGPQPVVASFDINVTIRGTGPAPTIEDVEQVVENAVAGLGGVSRANRPLMTAKARATRTDA